MTSHRVRRFTAALAGLVGIALVGVAVPAFGAADPGPQARAFAIDATSGAATPSGSAFEAFPLDTSYGANVAAGNLDGDSADELVFGTTGESTSQVRTTEANGTTIHTFSPYGAFAGGAFVAVGNLDGDPEAEIVSGAGPGGGPHVRVFNADGSPVGGGFMAYDPAFSGGVRVAVGDVDNDGVNEIVTVPGPGGGPHVRVFEANGASQGTEFMAYAPGFTGGVFVAAGELEGGGAAEIVTAPDAGAGAIVKVFTGTAQQHTFAAYDTAYKNTGVRVAVGQVNGTPRIVTGAEQTAGEPVKLFNATGGKQSGFDPNPDDDRGYSVAVANGKVVTAESGDRPSRFADWQVTTAPGGSGGPHVRNRPVPSGSLSPGFMAYEESFTGGVNVARGDLDGDGIDEIVTAPARGRAPLVKTFNADGSPRSQFLAYVAGFTGGVDVAVGDLDGDGLGEIVTAAGPGGGPHVRIFAEDGEDLTGGGFQAYAPTFRGGVRVTTGDLDGDLVDEIITAPAGGGGPHVKVFVPDGTTVAQFMAYASSFTGGVDVAAGDVDGDGAEEIITGAGPGGGPHVKFFTPDSAVVGQFMAYAPTFTGGVRVSSVDSNNDGVAEIVTGPGAGGGPHVRVLDAAGSEVVAYLAYAAEFRGGIDVAGGGV